MIRFSSTEIAYLMVGAQQVVAAAGWAIGARLMPATRSAALHWAACALLTGLSLPLFVFAFLRADATLRLAGNLGVTLALIALQRGVWHFYGAPMRWRWHGSLFALALAAAWIGMDARHDTWRMALLSAVMALLCLSAAWDIQALAGGRRQRRFGLAVAAPLACGAAVFTLRGVRALLVPQAGMVELGTETWAGFVSAFVYLVITLTFQLTLLALVFSRLVAELRSNSRRDVLTGVMNRRALEEALADEEHRAQRLQAPFAVLMIDADRFKGINDRHGHAAGDAALQQLAGVLGAEMRDIDRLGRYGGEEFLVLLPGTGLEQAQVVAERLRERVAATPLRWQDECLPLSVSVGVTAWRGPHDVLAAMLQRADAALYAAKAAGRNRCESEG